MVKLLFDIGNSFAKCAIETPEGLKQLTSLPLKELDTARAFASLAGLTMHSVWAVSVASKTGTDAFLAQLGKQGFQEIHLFSPSRSLCGISTRYREPEKLGGDRLLGMVAAWHRQQTASIVIDMGTAITIDALDASGFHLGGLIMPGIAMSVDSLRSNAARLDAPVDAARSNELFAKDTATAIAGGCQRMMAAALRNTVSSMRHVTGKGTTVFLSGGNAGLAMAALDGNAEHCPLLVLEGLSVYAAAQQSAKQVSTGATLA